MMFLRSDCREIPVSMLIEESDSRESDSRFREERLVHSNFEKGFTVRRRDFIGLILDAD